MCLRVRIYLCAYFVFIFRNALIVKWLVCLEDFLNKEKLPEIMPLFCIKSAIFEQSSIQYDHDDIIQYDLEKFAGR